MASLFSLMTKIALAKINMRRKTEYNHFKPAQIQCLKYAMEYDTLGILPTGYGKSLIFEALPILQSSAVIVISPLNSIIAEQLERYGEDSVKIDDNCLNIKDTAKYIIGHPENFISKKSFQLLRNSQWQTKVSNIVIDEAHCVSQWGEGFREQFLDIVKLRSLFPKANILALTATATLKMQKDVTELLGMKSHKVVQANIDRSNIKIEVKKRPAGCGGKTNVEDSYDFVFDPLIKELDTKLIDFPKTVVYSKLKWCGYGYEQAFRLSRDDNNLKQHVAQYHSPCTTEMRNKVLSSMADPNGMTKLLFATEAYIMGTDAPDIKRVIHAGVPTKLETYIQEIGRAGRDGSPAVATLFYNMTDISNSAKGMTDEMKNFCKLDTCRRDYLCQHFGFPSGSSVFVNKHECCDNCEKDCLCEICTEKQMLLCDNKQVDNVKPKKLQSSMKEHLELTLLEYFSAENEIIAVPNADLITGLSVTFAKEISSNHIFYTEKDYIINKHTILSPEIAENIALIVSALCLK